MDKTNQTKLDVWASNVLLASWLVSILHAGQCGLHMFDAERSWLYRGLFVVVYLLLANLYYYLRSGMRSIKTSFLLLMAVFAVNALPTLQMEEVFSFSNEPGRLLSLLASVLLAVGAVLVMISFLRNKQNSVPADK